MYWQIFNNTDTYNFKNLCFLVKAGRIIQQAVKGDLSLERDGYILDDLHVPCDKLSVIITKVFEMTSSL